MNTLWPSVQEVVQIVKVADCTLRVRKRVEEFWRIGLADLSGGDARSLWFDGEGMPPALVRGRECYEREGGARERGCEGGREHKTRTQRKEEKAET